MSEKEKQTGSRRGFFASLLAAGALSPTAAKALGAVDMPEPERIERMRPTGKEVFVIEIDRTLSQAEYARLREAWNLVWSDIMAGGPVPRVLILDSHLRLKVLEMRDSKLVVVVGEEEKEEEREES